VLFCFSVSTSYVVVNTGQSSQLNCK